MKHRKRRIACSVGCGIIAVLLTVLWFRSYYYFNDELWWVASRNHRLVSRFVTRRRHVRCGRVRSTRSRQVVAIWRLGTRPASFRAICHTAFDVLSNAVLVCMRQRRHLCGNSLASQAIPPSPFANRHNARCHGARTDRVADVNEATRDHPKSKAVSAIGWGDALNSSPLCSSRDCTVLEPATHETPQAANSVLGDIRRRGRVAGGVVGKKRRTSDRLHGRLWSNATSYWLRSRAASQSSHLTGPVREIGGIRKGRFPVTASSYVV